MRRELDWSRMTGKRGSEEKPEEKMGREECLAVCLTRMEKLVPDIPPSMYMIVIGLSLPILRQKMALSAV
jgi:hypothetical protein